ncbi:MAG: sensor histidine kinase [Paracoccaceae bacterium]
MSAFVSDLSVRLLMVTILVVMLVEVAIFVPSIARFRLSFLEERLVRAEIAASAAEAAAVPVREAFGRRLLSSAEALDLHVREDGRWRRVLGPETPPMTMARFVLPETGTAELIADALACLLFTRSGDVHYVEGRTDQGLYDRVGLTFRADRLRAEMLDYGLRILQLSLVISVVTAGVVFVVVRRFVVAPLLDVVRGVERFHADPEDPSRVMRPSARQGEVAEAERAIAAMQAEVLRALSERRRLAALGEAVARINHDLRNMLAAGRLMSERLGRSEDPLVARVLPKLVASLDRASTLCENTLAFGRAEERPPEPRTVVLDALVREVVEGLGLPADEEAEAAGPVRVRLRLAETDAVEADPEHLYRILANLLRNAAEAIRASGAPGWIEVSATEAREATPGRSGGRPLVEIRVADTGPGLPARAREHLFRPFRASARRGGTGLGLAIAADLARLQGGALALAETSTAGTVFALTLPAASRRAGRETIPRRPGTPAARPSGDGPDAA